jgi:hypothetical protein
MLRHLVLLRFRDDPGGEPLDTVLDTVVDGLRSLPGIVPSIRGYVVERDRRLADDNAHVAVVADFDDDAGFEAYRVHPAHVAVLEDVVLPSLESRRALQFEW